MELSVDFNALSLLPLLPHLSATNLNLESYYSSDFGSWMFTKIDNDATHFEMLRQGLDFSTNTWQISIFHNEGSEWKPFYSRIQTFLLSKKLFDSRLLSLLKNGDKYYEQTADYYMARKWGEDFKEYINKKGYSLSDDFSDDLRAEFLIDLLDQPEMYYEFIQPYLPEHVYFRGTNLLVMPFLQEENELQLKLPFKL